MKSIKPGRGPSAIGAVMSACLVVFGIFWTILAAQSGAPFFFPLFGVVFIAIGVLQAVYHFKNATGKNRYSSFDITDEAEELDPLNERFGDAPLSGDTTELGGSSTFCPYCGAPAQSDFTFCRNCGKQLPK